MQFSDRASPSTTEEEEVLGRERAAPGARTQGMKSLLSPTIYRGAKGGAPALVDEIY